MLWNCKPYQEKPTFGMYLSGALWIAKLPQSNLKWWIYFSNIPFKIAHGLQPGKRQRCGGCIKLSICSSHCSSLIYSSQQVVGHTNRVDRQMCGPTMQVDFSQKDMPMTLILFSYVHTDMTHCSSKNSFIYSSEEENKTLEYMLYFGKVSHAL